MVGVGFFCGKIFQIIFHFHFFFRFLLLFFSDVFRFFTFFQDLFQIVLLFSVFFKQLGALLNPY